MVVHTISTGDAKPFRHELRTVAFARWQYFEQKVSRLLAVGAIALADPSSCPYASRTGLALKDGTFRKCVDYRDLNAQTEKDSFPLMLVSEVWRMLAKARFFDSLDLLIEYHQLEVAPEDRVKTAFIIHQKL